MNPYLCFLIAGMYNHAFICAFRFLQTKLGALNKIIIFSDIFYEQVRKKTF